MLALAPSSASAQTQPGSAARRLPDVEFDMMTWQEVKAAINEQVAEQFIISGFRNVVLTGDHGGGQQQLVKDALGDPMPEPGQQPDPSVRRVNNGITGDGRQASAERGRRFFEMKVRYAVRQIRALLG